MLRMIARQRVERVDYDKVFYLASVLEILENIK